MSFGTFRRQGIYLALLLVPLPALAALGGNTASVNQDLTALRGDVQANAAASARTLAVQAADITPIASPYQVKAFSTSDGTVVREYVYKDSVFAVAWNGPVIPDLAQLFGHANYAIYGNAVSAQHKAHSTHSNRRALTVSEPTLVVHSYGRVPHFTGSAYIPGLIPAGVSTTDIQ